MNKEEALQRIAAMEAELAALKKLVNEPDPDTITAEDIVPGLRVKDSEGVIGWLLENPNNNEFTLTGGGGNRFVLWRDWSHSMDREAMANRLNETGHKKDGVEC